MLAVGGPLARRRARAAGRRRRGRHASTCASPTSRSAPLRMRVARASPARRSLRLVTTLVASEVERVRAPERASEQARRAASCARSWRASCATARTSLARAGGARARPRRRRVVVVARAHSHVADRGRLAPARRSPSPSAARARSSAGPSRRSASATTGPGAEVVVLLPGADDGARRARRRRRSRASCRPRCPATPSRSAAAALLRTRTISIGRPARRCWPRTSPRATPSGRCSRSRRRAPTGCCCRR